MLVREMIEKIEGLSINMLSDYYFHAKMLLREKIHGGGVSFFMVLIF
jgi:hypothetical protein